MDKVELGLRKEFKVLIVFGIVASVGYYYWFKKKKEQK